jgi:hypothetical protein
MKYVGYSLVCIGTLSSCNLLVLSGFEVLDIVEMVSYIQIGILTIVGGFFIVILNTEFRNKDKRGK